jgi:hypothetical protein
MAKKPQRGGKRPGAGRPRVPDNERRDQVFSVKLTIDEKQLLDETDARAWARATICAAAEKKRASKQKKS